MLLIFIFFFVRGSFVDALLIEARLAFLSVLVMPCIYFYCMQLHLRGDISVSFWWVWVCVCVRVCERAGEDTVGKIKQPVVTRLYR